MIVDKSFLWWTGVVEDRDDPEQLGRCRVRIFGYHTSDTNLLPTSDLPWAIPLQPTTSAATSGVGHTPVGIVPGTWVMGWFLDGDDAQRPIIMGTIAGKPEVRDQASRKQRQENSKVNVSKALDGNPLVDENNKYIDISNRVLDEYDTLVPLTADNVKSLFSNIAKKVSGNSVSKESANGDLGKYQISISTLIDLGYLLRSLGDVTPSTWADDPTNWVGNNSKSKFLASESLQESLMLASTKNNYDILKRLGKITETDNPGIVAGLLATAHVMGVKNADKLNKKDENGILAKEYFSIGSSSVGVDISNFDKSFDSAGNYLPEVNNNIGIENNQDLKNSSGFQDPNKKYPKYEYTGLSDVNKLAVGDTSHLSFIIKENKKIDKISLASTPQTWDEPYPAYGSVYPYNQVIETEAGHVIELDSTPGAERIQVFHKTGTYMEIDVNGTMVRKVVGDNYDVMDRNNFVYVKGAQCITVEGKTSILVKNDAVIEVEGDLNVTGHGDTNIATAGSAGVIAANVVVSAKNSFTLISEGTLNLQGKNIAMNATGGAITQKASGDISLQSGSLNTISLKGGVSLLFDAAVIKTKMGANTIRSVILSALKIPSRKTPDKTPIPVLQREVVAKSNYLFDSGEPGFEEHKKKLEKLGVINTNITSTLSDADKLAPASVPYNKTFSLAGVDDGEIRQFKYFPRSFILSNIDNRIFTLGDLLKDGGLIAQRGLSEQQIVYNLKQLAVNCLDPIKEKYPDMQINSGFRQGTNLSDHGLGAAVDMKFTNRSKTEYKDIADWIVNNVPHRQLLLEYLFESGSNKLRTVWIHLSFLTSNGALVKSSYAPVQTFVNHTSVYKKLVNLA